MGDFYLDFRAEPIRKQATERAVESMRFVPDTESKVIHRDAFSLAMTRVDGFGLWGPYENRDSGTGVFLALSGRIAMDEAEWMAAEAMPGPGGLACKALWTSFARDGIDGLTAASGNFVVILHDEAQRELHLVTDRCGMHLAYVYTSPSSEPVFASHPDVLANAVGCERQWDTTSLAEFVMTGRLTFPDTYYQSIRGVEPGHVTTVSTDGEANRVKSTHKYFSFDFQIDPGTSDSTLAEELAENFQTSVRKRTTARFGRTGVGLSGGLDSRAILSAIEVKDRVQAFSLYDRRNREIEIAEAIADACEVDYTPVQRDPNYYADTLELGVRISGGTGNIASNHFLGARDTLKSLGVQNLLTGCYCDYIFKGLALNTIEHKLTRNERLNGFAFEYYRPHYRLGSQSNDKVLERLEAQFPESHKPRLTDADWLAVERKRSFPLAYEADLAQRVIPQRVLPWYLPMADNDLLDLYLRIPSRSKLSAALFRRMVLILGDPRMAAIPDGNSDSRLDAGPTARMVNRYVSALKNRVNRSVSPQLATRGSWPNWEFFIHQNPHIHELWHRNQDHTREIFRSMLPWDPYSRPLDLYRGRDVELFLRLLTQKVWLEQRLEA